MKPSRHAEVPATRLLAVDEMAHPRVETATFSLG
jgi:hypothetical protein